MIVMCLMWYLVLSMVKFVELVFGKDIFVVGFVVVVWMLCVVWWLVWEVFECGVNVCVVFMVWNVMYVIVCDYDASRSSFRAFRSRFTSVAIFFGVSFFNVFLFMIVFKLNLFLLFIVVCMMLWVCVFNVFRAFFARSRRDSSFVINLFLKYVKNVLIMMMNVVFC